MTATHSFFGSRWVEAPGNVTELAGGLPRGFRAAGVACGIKPSGGLDLGLLVSSAPATTSAARFTRSGTQSAPVLLCRERVDADRDPRGRGQFRQRERRHRAPGVRERGQDAGRGGAAPSRCAEGAVAVASTGVIGVPLPIELGDDRESCGATHALRPDGEIDFAHAIRTTDVARQARLPRRRARWRRPSA